MNTTIKLMYHKEFGFLRIFIMPQFLTSISASGSPLDQMCEHSPIEEGITTVGRTEFCHICKMRIESDDSLASHFQESHPNRDTPLSKIDILYCAEDECTYSTYSVSDLATHVSNYHSHLPVDMVNHPPHYTAHPSGVECIDITRHMNFNLGNALKYIWRADLKNGLEDLKKAIWYLEDEVKRRENAG